MTLEPIVMMRILLREMQAQLDSLTARESANDIFRQQHSECDAMGVENQKLRARVTELTRLADDLKGQLDDINNSD